MLWDCTSCGTKGLLGRSHRHCPHCGAPQDQTTRYFPPEGTDIRVTAAYSYEGVDKVCPGCTTPNGGAAAFCKNCGSPLDGTPATVRERAGIIGGSPPLTPPTPQPTAQPTAPRSRTTKLLMAAAVVVVLAIIVSLVWKRDVQVRVMGHTWTRTIGIERYEPRAESEWCSSMPGDAYSVRRSREVRSQRQIKDGETCTTSRESRGDGSYVNKETCSPKYRSEPVYDDKCHYTVNRWHEVRSVNAAGASVADGPRWPPLPRLSSGTCLGCEREGQRRATYAVQLQGPKAPWVCDYDEARWRSIVDGAVMPLKVRVVTGGADCDSLGHR